MLWRGSVNASSPERYSSSLCLDSLDLFVRDGHPGSSKAEQGSIEPEEGTVDSVSAANSSLLHSSIDRVNSISKQLISPSLLLHTLFAFTFWSTREWIFMQGVGAFWVIMRLLACIGLGVMVREAYTGGLGKLASAVRYVDVRALFSVP